MSTKTWPDLHLDNKELLALYLAYNSSNDTQILVHFKKCLTVALLIVKKGKKLWVCPFKKL